MKKIINKKTYNTDTANEIYVKYIGMFGDEIGYEERLYETKSGEYFIYGVGGQESQYKEPTIKPLNDKVAEALINSNR